ncbi:hypothetical protein ACSBR1_013294 [Camellia fascicularis]
MWGLLLAIVVLGGILVTKHTSSEWEMVHQNLISILRRGRSIGQQHGGVMEVLALSFHDLPYQLKACFLCLGNYPEDVEIQAEKLYQLWMAEGIILPSSLEDMEKGEGETMMDVTKCYLDELAQRQVGYLQTLDLRMLEQPCIPNVLWKLELLQHLYLSQSLQTKNGDIFRLDGLLNIEMLENFHTYYCDVKDLSKLTNL